MSKLRQSVLEWIRTAGNNSGCHQLPERSFFYKDKQFPVCARCTGAFLGQTIAVILAVFGIFVQSKTALFLLLIMGFDWFVQAIKLKDSNNLRRFLTGILGGFGLFCLYINAVRKLIFFTKNK